MQLMASLIQLPIGFLINAGVLTAMLPTTFPRACLVVLFEYLIAIAIYVISRVVRRREGIDLAMINSEIPVE